MHLNVTQRVDRNQLFLNKTCAYYNYGKMGHLQNACRQIKKKTDQKNRKKLSQKLLPRQELAAT